MRNKKYSPHQTLGMPSHSFIGIDTVHIPVGDSSAMHYSPPQYDHVTEAYLGWASEWPAETEVCVAGPRSCSWDPGRLVSS